MWFGTRRQRAFLIRILLICAVCLVLGTLYLIFGPDPASYTVEHHHHVTFTQTKCDNEQQHRLALIVPFRDRFEELLEFVPNIKKFLHRQKICHEVFVVNQIDSLRFNRGALINIGYWLGLNSSCDYIAMHDVDLIPLNDALSYFYPSEGPRHIAAPDLHPKYNYTNFVGGILLMTNNDYMRVNSMSNRFWGWGREDDEFFRRMNETKLVIHRPKNINTGRRTFKHNHNTYRRKRDNVRYGRQTKMKKDRSSGVRNVEYTILDRYEMKVSDWLVHVVNVELKCNIRDTPWCMIPQQLSQTMKSLKDTLPSWQFKEIESEVRSKLQYDEYS